jgi:hypothetical protein
VKTGDVPMEYKATISAARAVAQRASFCDRPGIPRVEPCSTYRRPAAALVGGGLKPTEALICAECVRAMRSALDAHVATISPEELDEAAEVTSEEAYEQALSDEILWDLEPDGTLVEASDDPLRGRAWGRDARRAWGRP